MLPILLKLRGSGWGRRRRGRGRGRVRGRGRGRSSLVLDDAVYEPEGYPLLAGHVGVPVQGGVHLLQCLPAGRHHDRGQAIVYLLVLPGFYHEVSGGMIPIQRVSGLVHHDSHVRVCSAVSSLPGREDDGRHALRMADAHGVHRTGDMIHHIVDGEARVHLSSSAVNNQLDGFAFQIIQVQ